jgi:hypothetical protein
MTLATTWTLTNINVKIIKINLSNKQELMLKMLDSEIHRLQACSSMGSSKNLGMMGLTAFNQATLGNQMRKISTWFETQRIKERNKVVRCKIVKCHKIQTI